jgi:hypothetical protein
MITLTGKLRQLAEMKIKEQPKLKLVVEHETARNDGTSDLHLETLFVDPSERQKCPSEGSQVSLAVRPWASGKNVAYAASHVIDRKEKSA